MKKEILEKNVYYYTDVIEDPQKLIDAIESYGDASWNEWSACSGQHYVYGTDKTISSSEYQNIEDTTNDYIYHTIKTAFDSAIKDYAISQGITEEPKLFPMYPIKKYMSGTYMGAHFDQQEGDDRLKLSLVMYLNDDYEGGELSFSIGSPDGPMLHGGPNPDFSIAKDEGAYTFYIKPKAGSIIIFPPSPPYHHTAHLVKSGFKYMIPQHWIHKN